MRAPKLTMIRALRRLRVKVQERFITDLNTIDCAIAAWEKATNAYPFVGHDVTIAMAGLTRALSDNRQLHGYSLFDRSGIIVSYWKDFVDKVKHIEV